MDLFKACVSGNISDVNKILENGSVDVNIRNKYEDTPLTCAALNGHSNIVFTLLKYKANIEAQNGDGETALFIAAYEDTKTLLKYC